VILLQPNKNPKPAWLQGNYKGMAVFTYQGGQLADDATETYTRVCGDDFRLFATAVPLVGSVAEVHAAAKTGAQTYCQWPELPDVLNSVSGHYGGEYKGSYYFQWNTFVSNGPQLEDFTVHNFGTSDLAIPGGDRMRLHVRASSDRGLQEISITDKGRHFHRFLLQGKREADLTLDAWRDQGHDFVLQVTDADGGRALSSSRNTHVQEYQLVRCTDNLNTYFSGKFLAGKFFAVRGLENYVDRQAGGMVVLPRVENLPQTQRYAVDQRLRQVSRFGSVWELGLDRFYPEAASANWNHNDQALPADLQDTLRGKVTITQYTPWTEGTSLYLVDQELEVFRDIPAGYGKFLVFQPPWLTEAETVLVSRKQATPYVLAMKPRLNWVAGPADDVEYVAQLGPFGGSRAVVPLSPNLGYYAVCGPGDPPRSSLFLERYPANEPLHAGQKLNLRYAAVWGAMNGAPDNSFIENVVTKLGLRGQPAYQVKPQLGKVLDTALVLRLQAERRPRRSGSRRLVTKKAGRSPETSKSRTTWRSPTSG